MWRRCLHLRKLIISRSCKWLQCVSHGCSSMDYSSLVKLDLVACRGRRKQMIYDVKDNRRQGVVHICREGFSSSSLLLSRSVSRTYLHALYGWARSIEHTQLIIIIIICIFGSKSALDARRQGEEGSLIYTTSMFYMVNEFITDQHTLITFHALHFVCNKKVNRTRTFSLALFRSQVMSLSDDIE
jgi:hypothetical protein